MKYPPGCAVSIGGPYSPKLVSCVAGTTADATSVGHRGGKRGDRNDHPFWSADGLGRIARPPKDLRSHRPIRADVGPIDDLSATLATSPRHTALTVRPNGGSVYVKTGAREEPREFLPDFSRRSMFSTRKMISKSSVSTRSPDFLAPIDVLDLQIDFEIVGAHLRSQLPGAERCLRPAK